MHRGQARPTYTVQQRELARKMRSAGLTHREISIKLGIALSTVFEWVKGIELTHIQREEIKQRRRNRGEMSHKERRSAIERLGKYRREYTPDQLITRIKQFYDLNGRIPLKRDFNAWGVYSAHFGSWNEAIKAAGFSPNPILFSRKHTSKDGHNCDSFSEMIIDDWLHTHSIWHERHVPYGFGKYTADFKLKDNVLVEYFGLAGVQMQYDQYLLVKRCMARKYGWSLIEVYPHDLSVPNGIEMKLGHFVCK